MKVFRNDRFNLFVNELSDGSAIVIDEENEITFVLNETMSFIFLNCSGVSESDIINLVKSNFDSDHFSNQEIEDDIKDAIAQLELARLIYRT